MNPARVTQCALAALLAVAAAALVLWGASSVARHVVVSVFLLIGPGLAITPWWGLRSRLYEAVLAVALSVALATLSATAMLYTGTWSPAGATLLLAALSVIASAAYLLRSARGGKEMRTA